MKKQNKADWRIVCVGLACLTIAELYALSQGVNGTIFAIYVFIVAGVMGIAIPTPKFLNR